MLGPLCAYPAVRWCIKMHPTTRLRLKSRYRLGKAQFTAGLGRFQTRLGVGSGSFETKPSALSRLN